MSKSTFGWLYRAIFLGFLLPVTNEDFFVAVHEGQLPLVKAMVLTIVLVVYSG